MLKMKHKETGEEYLIIGKVQIKCPHTKAWCLGVSYISLASAEHIYVRYLNDIKNKFVIVGCRSISIEELIDERN